VGQIIYGIILFIITTSFSIIAYLTKEKIKDMEKDISEVRDDIKIIRQNYLDKFDDVKQLINENHVETLKALGEINEAVVTQSTYCKAIQDMKKGR
jgi:hypothetical protein